MTTPRLGDRITFTHILRRLYHDGRKYWNCQERNSSLLGELPENGILVGIRTLSNGTVSYADEFIDYDPKERFTAYLIAYDLRRRPVYVLPDHTTPEEVAQ